MSSLRRCPLVGQHYNLIFSFNILHRLVLLALILLVFIILLSIHIFAVTTSILLFILTISKLVVIIFQFILILLCPISCLCAIVILDLLRLNHSDFHLLNAANLKFVVLSNSIESSELRSKILKSCHRIDIIGLLQFLQFIMM